MSDDARGGLGSVNIHGGDGEPAIAQATWAQTVDLTNGQTYSKPVAITCYGTAGVVKATLWRGGGEQSFYLNLGQTLALVRTVTSTAGGTTAVGLTAIHNHGGNV